MSLDALDLPFMQRALVVVVLVGVVAGVVSTYVVLRRFAFFTDTLTHTVFPGVAIAFVAGGSVWAGALLAGIVTAVVFSLMQAQERVQSDAALAVILTSLFAVGVMVVSRIDSFTNDLVTLLFGQVLSVTTADIAVTGILGALAVVIVAVLHKELVGKAFDPMAMVSMGRPGALLDVALNLATTLVVVASVRAVGTTLVLALLVTPAVTGRLVTRSVPAMMAVSVLVAVGSGIAGLLISYEASVGHDVRLAPGATIVVVLTVAFAATAAVVAARRRLIRRPVGAEATA